MNRSLHRCGFVLAAAFFFSGAPAFAQTEAFSDQTALSQIDSSMVSSVSYFLGGGAVGDFDNDGWQDVFHPAGEGSTDKLFLNNRDGTFTESAAAWGIAVSHRSTAAVAGDFNGDGWLDLFVTSMGPASAGQPGHHKLYRNGGDRTFIDVAVSAGVNQSSATGVDGWGGAWGDFDLDGDLDLAVCGWQTNDGNRVYRNNGNETFTDVTASAGFGSLTGIAGFAPRFVDMNGDRYPEVIWIGDFSTSRYFVNNGDGTFTDRTTASGTSMNGTEMGSTVADWDEDGDFDFYVTTVATNNLYINQGNDVYLEQAAAAGVVNTGWGWGTAAVDFNHDSLVDIIATSQDSNDFAFRNVTTPGGSLDFVSVAQAIGLQSSVSGRGLSNLDYDNDGDQDIIVFPRVGPVKVMRNDLSGPNTNWLRVFLARADQTTIAPNGVGSVVKLTLGSRTLMGRIDGGSNYLSNSELSAHFGLGAVSVIDELRVEWTDGQVTTLHSVSANQTITITPSSAFQYCESVENSSGFAGRLTVHGSTQVAANDFTLVASQLPANRPGLFYFGPDQVTAPLGDGIRCVGGATTRLNPIVMSDAQGAISRFLDLTLPPALGSIGSGSTLNFQLWHRDAGGTSNLTNGVSATFQ